ncbi:MAG TPA: BlaI/MecI/CopY family transcriptional regulator [Actinomycetes bacterium]|nr:BlaI/MecI/CopY family transcriptional regulator [Actinomycetes bacterium]
MVTRRQLAGRRLGALEAEVMDYAWRRGDWVGVNDILATLHGQRRAYTTVMTIVTRLCDKGLLERERRGRGFVYRPALSQEELAARALRDVLASTDDPQAVLARFVEELEASPQLLARLRALAHDTPDPREEGR